jgi:hypothetical protein
MQIVMSGAQRCAMVKAVSEAAGLRPGGVIGRLVDKLDEVILERMYGPEVAGRAVTGYQKRLGLCACGKAAKKG